MSQTLASTDIDRDVVGYEVNFTPENSVGDAHIHVIADGDVRRNEMSSEAVVEEDVEATKLYVEMQVYNRLAVEVTIEYRTDLFNRTILDKKIMLDAGDKLIADLRPSKTDGVFVA